MMVGAAGFEPATPSPQFGENLIQLFAAPTIRRLFTAYRINDLEAERQLSGATGLWHNYVIDVVRQ